MKKIIEYIVLAELFLLITIAASAQNAGTQKTDKVIFLNGATKEGKVTRLMNDKIQFVHRGETLSYEFNKREIEKIEYASGRTELVTERMPEVCIPQTYSGHRVAVMPMTYIGDGSDERSDEMSYQLQEIAINCLSRAAAELRVMDAAELNAALYKNGIDDGNIRQFTPRELANILRVEYVVIGRVLQDKGALVTVSNNHSSRRQTRHYDKRGRGVIVRRGNNTGTYVTRQNIQTQVSLAIYNEAGEKIYARSRQSILSEQDAYKNAIQYLLKRTPLYNR